MPLFRTASSSIVVLALLVGACQTGAPLSSVSGVPDPLQGDLPGIPLSPREQRAVREAVEAAARGDWARSERALTRVPWDHPVAEFSRMLVSHLQGNAVAQAARAFGNRFPGYQPAWELAVRAAGEEGDLVGALTLAREQSRLHPGPYWERQVSALGNALVAHGLAQGRSLLADGAAEAGLSLLRDVLQHRPDSEELRSLAVRSALAVEDLRSAAELVAAMPDSAAGLELKGRVAEALGQMDLALQLFRQMPSEVPGRCALIASVWNRWRLNDAPPALRGALQAEIVSRREVAALLVWEVPVLAEHVRGPVPVLDDAVGLPEVGEILVAVRSGIMHADLVSRLFRPDQQVSGEALGETLARLARLLGVPVPAWCGTEGQGGCLTLPDVPSGAEAVLLIRQVVGTEETLCR